MTPLNIARHNRRYDALIGTGGIGTGSFFALNGNHTLGREESRTGRFLDNRDYAKLHIIAHYVQTLLGPTFQSLPIGCVGNDAQGDRLLTEMAAAGINVRHVQSRNDAPTMNCICLMYPDGSGGNLTADHSACAKVDAEAIKGAEADFAAFAGRGIALAVPEAPMAARARLLKMGTPYGFLRAASFTSEEMADALDSGILTHADLLVINRDEAATAVAVTADKPEIVAHAAFGMLGKVQPAMRVIVTAGAEGSWAYDRGTISFVPACVTDCISAAGAGDAFFAGVLSGLAAGLTLGQAQQLGTLTGGLSVTSPHTINFDMDCRTLAAFAQEMRCTMTEDLKVILGFEAEAPM